MDTKIEVVDSREAARYLGVSVGALAKWRADGSGPPFYRYSSRCVRYRRGDLDKWMSEREATAKAAQ